MEGGLAYMDAEGGNWEVYVVAFPDKGDRVQVSNASGIMPIWSRNGRELFYLMDGKRSDHGGELQCERK